MACKDVKKYIFIGVNEQKRQFFEEAQKKGIIHFIDSHQKKQQRTPEEIQQISNAIKVLRGLPTAEQLEMNNYDKALSYAREILDLKHGIEETEENIRLLHLEISRLEIFGNFSLDDIAYIEKEGNRKIQFFFAKKERTDFDELPPELIYVGSEHGLDYFIGIHRERAAYDQMIEMQFEHSLNTLKEKLVEARGSLKKMEADLKQYAKYNTYLHKALVLTFNKYQLEVNIDFPSAELGGDLFAVEGWVPEDKYPMLREIVNQLGVYYEEVAIEEGDTIPTYLENRGAGKIGEDLVHIYDTPSPTDKDPSMWVLGAFALFFGIIVGDAGYGLIYLLVILFLRNKFKHAKGTGRRVLNLAMILSVSCIVWGVMINSYFGVELDMNSPLRKVSILNWLSEKKIAYHLQHKDSTYEEWIRTYPELKGVADPDAFLKGTSEIKFGKEVNNVLDGLGKEVLLEIALFIGVVHIALSFLRYIGRNWNGLGWIAVMIGGYLYFPIYLGQTTMIHYLFGFSPDFGGSEGIQLIFGGIIVAVVLSLVQNRWLGLAEPMNLIQVFADVLSYLRLYALGLASAIVSETINELAGAVPILLAVILMSIAHVVNMLLGIMSGVIHGLRLNFLEWYHYSFEGGGKPFQPLELHEID